MRFSAVKLIRKSVNDLTELQMITKRFHFFQTPCISLRILFLKLCSIMEFHVSYNVSVSMINICSEQNVFFTYLATR